ncbi:g-patch domain-containing protein [Ditylenchus destructor]|nr:g-patch domain-containing protein [Ditylenchus destructor]
MDDESEIQFIEEKSAQGTSLSKDQTVDSDLEGKGKKKRKKEETEDPNKPKTAQDIQREMAKWARRQEKVKMTFKQPEPPPSSATAQKSTELSGDIAPHMLEMIKKPWDDGEDEDEEVGRIPEGVLPRMRNVGLPLNVQRGVGSTPVTEKSTTAQEVAEPVFDEQFLDRRTFACLLCRRKLGTADALNKHIQLSELHKTNIAAKIRELQPSATEGPRSKDHHQEPQYRDRAKERRQLHGYGDPDPSGLTSGGEHEGESRATEALAAHKAATPLDESNIGNKMLKSMGWSEGKGLGRHSQGIVNPLMAEQRVQGVGLGASGSKIDSGMSRKDRLKQAAIQRYNDLSEKEQRK